MEIDTWLAGITDRMNAIQQKSAELTETMAAAGGAARSPDGAVTVEVGANGGLQNIQFGKEIEDITPTQLGELVLRTARAAQRQASEKVATALGEFGGDGELMTRYVNYQPPMEPDELRELESDPEAANAGFGVAAEEPAEEMESAAPAQPTPPPPPAPAAPPRPRRAQAQVDDAEDEENAPW